MRSILVADKGEIDALVRKHPPYSDFTFLNLWSWNGPNTRVALLNGNLLLRFIDYLNGEPLYTFLGDRLVSETAGALLDFLAGQGLPARLGIVPECAAAHLDCRLFSPRQNPDHSDYIIDLDDLAELSGRKWHRHRNFVHRFCREAPNAQFVVLDPDNALVRRDIFNLFEAWSERKDPEGRDSTHEREALERCLRFGSELIVAGVYVADRLIGFSVVEPVPKPYAINHFEKADRWAHTGVLQFLQWRLAHLLWERGVRFLNIEQDLGLPGLRRCKQARRAASYLHKYDVTPVEPQVHPQLLLSEAPVP